MYVCICVGVTDKDIKAAIDAGHNTLSDLMFETGAGLGCGTCRNTLEQMIIDANGCAYREVINVDIPVIKSF